MSFTPALLALGVILIFAAIVFFAFRSSRVYQAEKEQQLNSLGFQTPEAEPFRLQRRVEDLYQPRQQGKMVLNHVYHRRELDQDIYIFDLQDTGGEGSELGQEIFGLISNQLALPQFSLTTLPDFDRDSLLGGLMDTMLEKVMDLAQKHLGLERVEFPDRPEYEDQFVIFGRDPFAVREFLSGIRLHALRRDALPVQIAGSGDFLTVDFSVSGSYAETDQDLISQYNRFRELSRIFMK